MTLEQQIELLKYENIDLKLKIKNLEEKLFEEREKKEEYAFRIEKELEPRLQQEAHSYDCWALTDHSAEACESFEYKVDELVEMVKDEPQYFLFESRDQEFGLSGQILYLIKKEEIDGVEQIIEDKM